MDPASYTTSRDTNRGRPKRGCGAIHRRADPARPVPCPRYDTTEVHAVVVDADLDTTWEAIRRGDLGRSRVVRVLLELRNLPNRLQRVRTGRPWGSERPPLTLDDMARAGFILLGERPR